MHPIPAVEVPIEAPKPPPRPELHVVAFPFYEEGTKSWYWTVYLSQNPPHENVAKTPGVALFRLPAEHPAPNADWRERCVVERAARGCWWNVWNGPGREYRLYGYGSGETRADWAKRVSDVFALAGNFPDESDARRALAAAPQPPGVVQ